MFVNTHRTIALNVHSVLWTERNIKLNLGMFVAGNMIPDLHVDYVKQKHYRSYCYEQIRAAIIELSNTRMTLPQFSYKAGIICHYLSDFFCYPHDQEWIWGKGNTKEHIAFEEKQYQLAKDKFFTIKKCANIKEFEELYIDFFVENLIDEYKHSVDYLRDVDFAVTASYNCVEALLIKMFSHNIIMY